MTDCHEVNYEGMGTRVNRHPCEPIIAYPSGNSIIICSVMDPSDAYIYKGHSKSTTIAKFSPNVRSHIQYLTFPGDLGVDVFDRMFC